MGEFSIWHWLVVLIIVLVLFGTKNLRNIGSDLGGAVRNFKRAMKETDDMKNLQEVQPDAFHDAIENRERFDS